MVMTIANAVYWVLTALAVLIAVGLLAALASHANEWALTIAAERPSRARTRRPVRAAGATRPPDFRHGLLEGNPPY